MTRTGSIPKSIVLSGPTTTLLALVFLLFSAITAQAQSNWDPRRYADLVDEGDELFTASQTVPENDVEQRRELLLQAAGAKQQALDMLLAGLLLGEIETSQSLARRDFFNLNQNVIAILLLAEECTAAEFLLDRALENENLLDRDGIEYLTQMRERVSECKAQIERVDWGRELFDELLARADESTNELVALRLRQDAQAMLATALARGTVPTDDRPELAEALLGIHRQNVTQIADFGWCELADAEVGRTRDQSDILPTSSGTFFTEMEQVVQTCRDNRVDLPVGPGTPTVVESGPPIVPIALLSVAGMSLASALIYDISLGGQRQLLDDLQSECADGFCNVELARETAINLDDGKVVLGVFTGIAVATGVTGLILLLLDDDEADAPGVTAYPWVSPTQAGAAFQVRY